MKHLKKFQTQLECEAYINSEQYVEPFVGLVAETSGISYNKHDYSNDYLTFNIESDGKIYFLSWDTSIIELTISYSKDNGNTWSSITSCIYDEEYTSEYIEVNNGDKVLFKGNNNTYCVFNSEIGQIPCQFFIDCQVNIEGNIMSLIYGDNFKGQTIFPQGSEWTFYDLFIGNEELTSAENLILPSTTLTRGCYCAMFQGCTSLTTAPELPATTLADMCYEEMFRGCSSLNYIKCLATNISASDCTHNWVDGAASTGTFVKNPNMSSWTTGTSGIPEGWTIQDAS